MNEGVDILLSTFNGEKFLNEQLDSIVDQDHSNWQLIIRDDGSTDSTVQLLHAFQQRFPEKVKIIKDEKGNLGFCNSFTELLPHSTSNYILFCDQDDRWKKNKISTLLSCIRSEEEKKPASAHLVFSDLGLINEQSAALPGSFLDLSGYKKQDGQQVFFLKNYVPGCNLLFNKKLLSLAMETSNHLGLHDHWLLFNCAAIGKITFVDQQLMDYRVHGNNTIGMFEKETQHFGLSLKIVIKYFFNNSAYRKIRYEKNLLQRNELANLPEVKPTTAASLFLGWEHLNYFKRKSLNISTPFIREKNRMKQFVYICCF